MRQRMLWMLLWVTVVGVMGACQAQDETFRVSRIEVDLETVDQPLVINQHRLEDIVIIVHHNDGEVQRIPLTETMVLEADRDLLFTEGTHSIRIVYEGVHTSVRVTFVEDALTLMLQSLHAMGVAEGLIDTTYEEWLSNVRGEDGVGVAGVIIDARGHLVVTLTDESVIDVGLVAGPPGEDGIGVEDAYLDATGRLWIDLTDGTVLDLGVIAGAPGISAYDIYVHHHPGFTEGEMAWLEQLVAGTLRFAPTDLVPFTFTVVDDTYAIITAYTGDDSVIEVPNWLAGYDVLGVAENAFEGLSGVTTIDVEQGVQRIDSGAFSHMEDLHEVHFPLSVIEVGENVFLGTTDVVIYTEHEAKPETWHEDWNPPLHPVAWHVDFDYHELFNDLILAPSLTVHTRGFEGEALWDILMVYNGHYLYMDMQAPNFLSEDTRTTLMCTQEGLDLFLYNIDVEQGCYTEKSIIFGSDYAFYISLINRERDKLYYDQLETAWFVRTVTGFTLPEAYLSTIGDIIHGEVFSYDIVLLDEGFTIHMEYHHPLHDGPGQVTQTFTHIGTTSLDLPDPCRGND